MADEADRGRSSVRVHRQRLPEALPRRGRCGTCSVLVAIGVNSNGFREILGVAEETAKTASHGGTSSGI